MTSALAEPSRMPEAPPRFLPRLGFLGVGWIGRQRMAAIAQSGAAEVCAIADPSQPLARQAGKEAPRAALLDSLDALLDLEPDGIVIATPSALHAEQCLAALDRGIPVFCQKPLARTAAETARVIEAAHQANRLLGVDLSYRWMAGAQAVRQLIRSGELGEVYAADLVFHNAYGPDKPWFYDPKLSGGGCVIDLGIHLADLALWLLDFPAVTGVTSRLFAGGKPWGGRLDACEDYATARLDLATGAVLSLACSWKLPVGQEAVIEAHLHGTRGGATIRNLNGSFHEFVAEQHDGTTRRVLAGPPDDWGGRAAVAWAERLGQDRSFDPEIAHLVDVAAALDAIYANDPVPPVRVGEDNA
jgi:predicted dehydrogenase